MSDYLDDMKTLATAMEGGDQNTLRDLHRKACIDLEIFKTLPCNGRMELPSPREEPDRRSISNCDHAFSLTCHMRDHRACPRVLRDKQAHLLPSPSDRAAELRRALVPAAIAKLIGFEAEKRSASIAAADEWASSGKRVLVISGGTRAGKTVAACWLIRRLGKSALFFNPELLTRYGGDDGYQMRAASCGLLIVDDLGSEMSDQAGRFQARLEAMLCMRYDAGERTVLTTNLTAGDFAKRYGKRISERVRTGGKFAAVGAEVFPEPEPPASHWTEREPGEEG